MSDPAAATPFRIWFRFLRLHQRAHVAMSHRLRAIGLSVAQFDLLSTLTESEGITQRDLAERLYVTKGNVSGLVDRLVEAGFVDRRAIPGDRRSYALHLTEAGRRIAGQGMAAQRDFVEATIGSLPSSQLDTLDQAFSAWRDALKLVEGRASPNNASTGMMTPALAKSAAAKSRSAHSPKGSANTQSARPKLAQATQNKQAGASGRLEK